MVNHISHTAIVVLILSVSSIAAAGQRTTESAQLRSIDSALVRAVMNRDLVQVKSLLAEGANPNTVVHMAHWSTSVLAEALPRREKAEDLSTIRKIVKALLDAGLGLTPSEPGYVITMATVVAVGDGKQIDLLLEFGADINARGPKGRTFLMMAAGSGDERCVKDLLKRGADPCLTDEDGHTAAEYPRLTAPGSDGLTPEWMAGVVSLLEASCSARQPN